MIFNALLTPQYLPKGKGRLGRTCACQLLFSCHQCRRVPEYSGLCQRCAVLLLAGIVIGERDNLLDVGSFHYCALDRLPDAVTTRLAILETANVARAVRKGPSA